MAASRAGGGKEKVKDIFGPWPSLTARETKTEAAFCDLDFGDIFA